MLSRLRAETWLRFCWHEHFNKIFKNMVTCLLMILALWMKDFYVLIGCFVCPINFLHFKFLVSITLVCLFGCCYHVIYILKYSPHWLSSEWIFFLYSECDIGSKYSSRRTDPFWGIQACDPWTFMQPYIREIQQLAQCARPGGADVRKWYWEMEVGDKTV